MKMKILTNACAACGIALAATGVLTRAAAVLAAAPCAALADLGMGRNDEWRSLPVDRVRLNGPLGRRISLTATNNLMKIDLEKDFFGPFRNKTSKEGFIGLGTAIATRCANVDWARWIKPTDPEILLTEFADEEDTLTYFRTPDPDSPLLVDDELFGKTRRCH